MDTSVQSVCNLLAKCRLMAGDDVRNLFGRWRSEAGEGSGDVNRFRQWLVVNRYVTDYQADRLFRGQTDHYFINQYKLLDRIGQGRMAGVYKAAHPLGQVVAIKVLPPSKSKDATTFARFSREARMAQKLKHPNVVRTFQTGESAGLYYLVMEYLEGETLKDVLQRRGKLPPGEAVRLIMQALNGLQHIHELSMCHRDLEPGNLMLVPAPETGDTLNCTVKILDIGLGRVVFDEDGPAGPNLTTDGVLLGKPDYMAPEQARNAHAADVRSDMYSLGCVLYHTLAGQPPFADKQAVRIMIRHATEAPPPLKPVNPAVSEGLEQVLHQMMAKDPAQRFPTPQQAVQALRPFLGGGNVQQGLNDDANMQAYLRWLSENNPDVEPVGAAPAYAAASAVAAPPQYEAAPVPAPQYEAAPMFPSPEQLEGGPAPHDEEREGFTLSPRDWIFLGAGAAVLVVIGLLLWMFVF